MTLDQEIAALPRLTLSQLRGRYAHAFGEATTARNKPWLVRRIAWRLQERAEGGLTERARRRAAELADDADLRVLPPRVGEKAKPETMKQPRPTPVDLRLPPPGTILRRTYKGRNLAVRVLADGFEHGGTIYPSLSAVAKAITGSHMNGFAFFNLTGGKR